MKNSKVHKDLAVDLSFIGSIIHPEDNDLMYLKDYAIPRLEKHVGKDSQFARVF